MGHELLSHDKRGPVGQPGLGYALGGVHALDLRGIHLHVRALLQVYDRRRVHNALAGAVALGVVLFHVLDLGVPAHIEGVYAVVLAVLAAAVGYAAAGYYRHVTVGAYVEVVINEVLEAALLDNDGYVHALVLGAGLYEYVDAGLVLFGDDVYVGRRAAPGQLAVGADVVSALRHTVQVGYLGEQRPLYCVHCHFPHLLRPRPGGRRSRRR